MKNEPMQTIDLGELATVTGGRSIQVQGRPSTPTYKSADGKVRVFEMSGGKLEILNLARTAHPRRVVVSPVTALGSGV
jgi:hypothetical protein